MDVSERLRLRCMLHSMEFTTLGAVRPRLNSFHLEIGPRRRGPDLPLDSMKETVRLASGLTADKLLATSPSNARCAH